MNIEEIDIGLIEPNVNQPRTIFNEEHLEELKRSIKIHGLIQPIVVQKSGETFKIIAGERRWRAAMDLKFKKIPAIVKDIELNKRMEISLIENIQRENLNPIEEARFYKVYLQTTGATQEDLSDILGKSRSYISNAIRLLKLPEVILDSIATGEISSGHGRTILSLEDERLQLEIWGKVKVEKLSVRELEKLILKSKKDKSKSRNDIYKDIYIEEVERKLSSQIGSKVSIKSGKNKGKLEIEYYDEKELEDIVELLSRCKEKF